MTIYKVLFENIYTILALLTMGLFFGFFFTDWGDQKGSPPKNMSYIPYNDNTWHSYTLPKEDQKKYINHMTHHLSSADSIFSPKIRNFCYTKN